MTPGLLKLHGALVAAGVPLAGVADVTGQVPAAGWYTVARPDGKTLRIDFGAGVTPAQESTAAFLAQTFTLGDRAPRTLAGIYGDLKALTAAQKTNVWADLAAGTPPKYLTDEGPNAAAIGVLDWAATDAGATGAALTAARLRIAAAYCQDNPGYLVQPPFDPSINVAGDQPA